MVKLCAVKKRTYLLVAPMIKQYRQTVAAARRRLEKAVKYAMNNGDVMTAERLEIIIGRLRKEEGKTEFKHVN